MIRKKEIACTEIFAKHSQVRSTRRYCLRMMERKQNAFELAIFYKYNGKLNSANNRLISDSSY